ncbi:RNA recognition motif 2, Nucleotide-binding alpha-beta plait domain protein [Artemisia annua]|uniref:RNA recognition motif 2, Nucleotide-binding alpha-beta plait domain protein n=1 Tax=Artemisia annua TaxID=35608 RepID=A0A2U1PF46_ARTAN|nr:RNA recognition motif 2, Nucleotide-binding alpha-beta plait domain protein [Artemisia annua]
MATKKPLDPMATPYHKISTTPKTCFNNVYVCPQSPFYHRIFRPVFVGSPFQAYNVKKQPTTQWKPLPKSFSPSPVTKEKGQKTKISSLTPVPTGPRIPRSRLPRHCRKMVVRVPQNEMKVVAENKGKQRWKNGRGEYHKVLPFENDTTSVMIKNIPNKYTRKLLMQTLDNHCKLENDKNGDKGSVSAYDFLYLPIDFHKRGNAGFAFVNFTTPEGAVRFRDAFDGQRWECFESGKIAMITKARIQGKVALVENCKRSDFTSGSEEDMPVWFAPARDGSDQDSKMFVVGRVVGVGWWILGPKPRSWQGVEVHLLSCVASTLTRLI